MKRGKLQMEVEFTTQLAHSTTVRMKRSQPSYHNTSTSKMQPSLLVLIEKKPFKVKAQVVQNNLHVITTASLLKE